MDISKKKFLTLEKYFVPNEVTNTEGQLFVVENHEKRTNKRYLLKKLYIDKGQYFGNKLMTINTLIDNSEEIGIPQLVLPEKIAIVDRQVVGFAMPLIENSVNLSCLLGDFATPIAKKIDYLKQVGAILKHVQRVEKFEGNFFLGDVHEGNFVVEQDIDKVHAIDLDSCKISDNTPFASKYLATDTGIRSLPRKYPVNAAQMHIPNANTEWLCYILMVLNFIAHGPVHKMLLDEYYLYLQYLRDLGFSNELLDCFNRIYVNCDNHSPEGLLDQIPQEIKLANYNVFKYKASKKK